MIYELTSGHDGRSNPITTLELMAMTGLSKRQVEARIHEERVAGAVLCACPRQRGYYRPVCAEEIREYLRMSSNRAVKTLAALRSARAELRRMEFEELHGGKNIDGFGVVNAPDVNDGTKESS